MSTTAVWATTTLGWQTLAVQRPPWQLCPQSWQFVGSCVRSTQRLLHSVWPAAHSQAPKMHMAPGSHAWLQPPQLVGSVCVFTHMALQLVSPPSHPAASSVLPSTETSESEASEASPAPGAAASTVGSLPPLLCVGGGVGEAASGMGMEEPELSMLPVPLAGKVMLGGGGCVGCPQLTEINVAAIRSPVAVTVALVVTRNVPIPIIADCAGLSAFGPASMLRGGGDGTFALVALPDARLRRRAKPTPIHDACACPCLPPRG